MQKLTKRISLVMVALMTVFTALSYVPAKAATVVPKVQFVGEQAKEFTAGERVTFNLNASNYGGRVQYRVVLWNDSTKSYGDLWNTADKYYTNWMPYGNETLPLGWVINEPGTYRITVYAKRAGLANSKTALKGMNCDSYLNGPAFVVKPAAVTPDSIAPVADVTVNEGEKPVLPETVTINLADKTTKTAKVTWAAVDTAKAGEYKVEGTVEGTDKKASVKVIVKAVALEVKEVSATNLKEIVVKFSKAVDKAQAETITNYSLDGNTLQAPAVASVQEDGKTVVIQLRKYSQLTNQRNYKLAVRGISGVATAEKTFAPLDVTVPTVEKVEVLGNKVVNVTFSEPVAEASATTRANYRIDGFVTNGNPTLSSNLKTVSINLYSRLSAGEHKISVTGVNDYANMTIVNYLDQVFTVAEDKVAPESFTITKATLDYAEISFSEPIDATSLLASNIYWSDNAGTTKYLADGITRLDSTYKNYEISFPATRRLPARATTLYIEKAMDMHGNTAAKLNTAVTAIVDTERPEIVGNVDLAKDTNGNYYTNSLLTLKWNKVIDLAQFGGVNANNLVVKNSKDEIVAISSSAQYPLVNNVRNASTTIEVFLTSPLTQSKTYTVEVKNVTDGTALDNKMIPQTFTITVPEYTAPSINNVSVQKIYSGARFVETNIQVVYSNVMALGGQNSMLDASKYMIRVNDTNTNAGVWYVLPQGSIIQPSFDNRAAIISIPDTARYNGTNTLENKFVTAVKVSLVEDRSGNKLVTDEIFNNDATRWGINAAKIFTASDREPVATGKKTIRLTYDRPLQYVVARDFSIIGAVDASGNPINVVNAQHEAITLSNGTSRGEVILTLSADLPANPSGISVRVAASPESRDLLGNAILSETTLAIRDGIAPSLASSVATTGIEATAANQITITFNEPVMVPSALWDSMTAGMFVVTDGLNDDVLVPGKDYTAKASSAVGGATTVVITLLNSVDNLKMTVATNDSAMMITDVQAAAFAAKANKVKFVKTLVEKTGLLNVTSVTSLAAVNAAANATDFAKAIVDNATALGLTMTDYTALGSTYKLAVDTAVYNSGTDYATIAALKTKFDAEVATQKALEAAAANQGAIVKSVNDATSATMQSVIEANATALGIDLTAYNNNLTGYEKATVGPAVFAAKPVTGYATITAVKLAFDTAVTNAPTVASNADAAVKALYNEVGMTTLKTATDQAAVDAAIAKVNLMADQPAKTALLAKTNAATLLISEKAKVVATATILKGVAATTDVTSTVLSYSTPLAGTTAAVTALGAKNTLDDNSTAVLGLAAGAVTLTNQVPNTDAANATIVITVTVTVTGTSETVTTPVTVIVEKQ